MAKETIMVAGPPGAGKSTALWQLYYHHWDKKSPTFIFDSEGKMRGVHDLFGPTIPDDVTIIPTTNFTDMVAAFDDEIKPALVGKDETYGLVLIDMVDKWWEKAQEYWVMRMSETGEGSFAEHVEKLVIERREHGKSGISPFEDGFVDWPVVKRWHNGRLLEPLLYEQPCHVVASCGTREIRTEGFMMDSLDRRTIWKEFKQLPEGEKRNEYRFTTLLGLQMTGLMEPIWTLSLVKDRSRMFGKRVQRFKEDLPEDDNGIVDMWKQWSFETDAPEMLVTTGGGNDD